MEVAKLTAECKTKAEAGNNFHTISNGETQLNITPKTDKEVKLTLNDIRAGLGIGSTSNNLQVFSPASGVTLLSPSPKVDRRRLSTELVPPDIIRKLVCFCYELLGFISCLEEKRSEGIQEWCELYQVVRQFENLYDSVRVRDSQFFLEITELQNKFDQKEIRYKNLIKRAMQHIQEATTEFNQIITENEAVKSRHQELQSRIATMNGCIEEQKKQLQALQEKSKDMPSEKEMTKLSLKLRHLQNEYSQLMTQCTSLRSTADELALSCRDFNSSDFPQFCQSNVISKEGLQSQNTTCDDSLPELKIESISDYEQAKSKFMEIIEKQEKEFNIQLKTTMEEKRKYQDYTKVMEEMLTEKGIKYDDL